MASYTKVFNFADLKCIMKFSMHIILAIFKKCIPFPKVLLKKALKESTYIFNCTAVEAYFEQVKFIAAILLFFLAVFFFIGGLIYGFSQTLPGISDEPFLQKQKQKVMAVWG